MSKIFDITLVGACAATILSACGSLNGFSDAKGSYGCKAPDGVSCTSVSGIYANAQQNNLPAIQAYRKAPVPTTTAGVGTGNPQNIPQATPGMPIRSQARTLRLWVAPWVDDDGDLHDQTFMYVVVDPGKWLVEHSREATVKRTLTTLQVLGKPNVAQPSPSATPSTTPQPYNAEADARQAAVVPQGDPQ